MINKKIAASALSIIAALTVTGGTAYALFSDTATSTGNTFSSGNADLDVASDTGSGPGTFNENLTDAFNVTGVFPGYDQVHRFWLTNISGSTINLSMVADVSNYTAPDAEDIALADNLLVSWRCDLNNNESLADEVYTSEFSVKGWFDGGNTSLGDIAHNDQMICEMRTRVLDSVQNTIANGSVDFDVAYNATQL